MTAHLLLVVLVVLVMIRARNFKMGGQACNFCGYFGVHAPDCPARGMQ